MKAILSLAFCVFLFENCENAPKNNQAAAQTVDSTQLSSQTVYSRPTFIFTTTVDTVDDTPHSVVSFAYGKTVEKIDSTLTGEFHFLHPDRIKEIKLPKSYIVAGSAFWAGLQVTLVIDSTSKGYTIRRQEQDEQGSGKEPFEVVKTFPK